MSSSTLIAIIAVVVVFFVALAFFVWKRNQKRGLGDGLPHPVPGPASAPISRDPFRASPANVNPRSQPKYANIETPANMRQQPPQQPVPQPPRPMEPRRPQPPPVNVNRQPPPAVPSRAPTAAAPMPRPPKKAEEGNNTKPQDLEKARRAASRVMSEFRTHPALGRQILPYSALYFTRVLNKGAFGEVWLAQLENRQVAVKRILNEKKYDEKEIECFASEIKLMASFSHPKVVEFIGVSWSDTNDMCAVTEYMAKGDLYGFLKRKGSMLNWRDHKIYLAEDAADAMGYLHSLTPKVIHRDLKSKNILLDDSFRAKLSDFGISRERSLEETMTAGVGTIYWTAPEVLMGKKYTEKADIYSFGIVMSELDTHEVPYSDLRDDAGKKLHGMKVVQMVIRKQLRPTFSPNCPHPVKALAMQCLDSDPDNRPDAFELLERIQNVQDELTED